MACASSLDLGFRLEDGDDDQDFEGYYLTNITGGK